MLTNAEALDVVIRCVNGVSGQVVTPDRTLKSGGIVDSPRLSAFKSLVVTDPSRGVQRHNHRIDSSDLAGISIDDTVQATSDVVRANAVAIAVGVMLEEADVVVADIAGAPTGAAKTSARARRKAAARRVTRKAAKKTTSRQRRKSTGKKKASSAKARTSAKRARKSRGR
jgi:hypothetical protein